MTASPARARAALSTVVDTQTQRVGATEVVAVPSVITPLATLLATHDSLYDWAAGQPQPRALRGRAPVFVAALPDNGPTVVVRHAWHGGFLAPITADRFRRPSRAPIELQRSAALRAAGIPTTEVLGFVRYPAALGLCRIDVVTRYVDHAADLGMVLAGLSPNFSCDAALEATQTLLVQLARSGVIHPDLNVKNVLLRPTATDVFEALVIDVDVVRWDPERPPADTMAANVARLTRSVRKWHTQFGCDVGESHLAAFTQSALAALQ